MSEMNTETTPETEAKYGSSPVLKYAAKSVIWDLIKGFLALCVVSVPLFWAEPVEWLRIVLLILNVVFLAFIIKVGYKLQTEFVLTNENFTRIRPFPKQLQWAALDSLRLKYYSTKRSGDDGWMDLQLKAGRVSINVNSHLDGFDVLVRKAVQAAQDRNLSFDRVTVENLRAFNITLYEDADIQE